MPLTWCGVVLVVLGIALLTAVLRRSPKRSEVRNEAESTVQVGRGELPPGDFRTRGRQDPGGALRRGAARVGRGWGVKHQRPSPWAYRLVKIGSVIMLLAAAAIILLSNVEAP